MRGVNSTAIRFAPPRSSEDWQTARRLIEEYAGSLDVDLAYQNISHELDHLAQEYAAPGGAFLLATQADVAVGCIGVRRFTEDTCEMKRLYVAPAARGKGVGRLLTLAILDEARQLGYARLLLDTLPSMQDALALYLSLGFRRVEPYRFSPVTGTTFLELTLG